jgi:hypothetical protein
MKNIHRNIRRPPIIDQDIATQYGDMAEVIVTAQWAVYIFHRMISIDVEKKITGCDE